MARERLNGFGPQVGLNPARDREMAEAHAS